MDLTLQAHNPSTGTSVVEVDGEVDVFTAPQLRDALIAQIDAGHHHLIVDLRRVQFLDSTGLGVLVGSMKRAKDVGGDLSVVCDNPRLLKIFSITGLDKVFQISAEPPDLGD